MILPLSLYCLWREDMSLQRKHWMVTLQEVFYPALAAVGIPCKYKLNVELELLADLKPKYFSVLWRSEMMLLISKISGDSINS